METMVSFGVPGVTPVGSGVSKPSRTDSPSSLSLSLAAVKLNVFSVSPLLKVRFSGTPL